MNVLVLIQTAFSLATLPPMLPDTPPPPPPLPVERLAELKTMQDVISASLLADGRPAPAHLVLPELENRHHTLEFMRVHYPESMRGKKSQALPIAWLLVDERGKVQQAQLLTSSGFAELDSLSVDVLDIASFRPAQLDGRNIGVWIPFPARIPPHDELIEIIKASTSDVSEVPTHTPYTQKPVLLNRNRVEAAIVRVLHGPNRQIAEINEMFARAQQLGGKTELWLFIDKTGAVANVVVKKTSGNKDLDTHALAIAKIMNFAPAKNGDEPVDVWLEVPIQFKGR